MRNVPHMSRAWFALLVLLLGLLVPTQLAHAAAIAPPLGAAGTFAVVGASTVTNTGPTRVIGNLGVSPGTAVAGFGPGIVIGQIHAGDVAAAQAHADASTAYGALARQSCNTNMTGTNLGGLTLVPGSYCFNTSAQLTGTLTLNGQGNANSIFVFQIGSTLTTATNASMLVTNGANPCNIYWQVGSSATVGTYSTFTGRIFAYASNSVTSHAAVRGGLYALNGAVTLDSNIVQGCNSQSLSASTTLLSSSRNPAHVGETVVLQATVSSGAGTPTGTVSFYDGSTLLGTVSLNGGSASLSTATLGRGTHSITAVYSGDANFTSSTSSVLNQVVNQATSSIVLVGSPNPSGLGQNVTFTATISPGVPAPTGTVTFKDNNVAISSAIPVGAGGVAAFTTNGLSVGSHPITAVYTGDTNYIGSTSNTFNQVVNAVNPPSAPTVTKSFNPSGIQVNGSSTLSFLVTNPNASMQLTNISFSDTVVSQIVVPSGALGGNCGGTATAAGNAISVSNVTLNANASCTITVTVGSSTVGAWNNTTGVVSSTQATGTTSNMASLTVTSNPPPPGCSVNAFVQTGSTMQQLTVYINVVGHANSIVYSVGTSQFTVQASDIQNVICDSNNVFRAPTATINGHITSAGGPLFSANDSFTITVIHRMSGTPFAQVHDTTNGYSQAQNYPDEPASFATITF